MLIINHPKPHLARRAAALWDANVRKHKEKQKQKTGNIMDKRHGSAYDRGSADAYYHRPQDPHYYKKASYSSDRVDKKDMSDEQKAEYLLGYHETTDRKDWGEEDGKLATS